MTRTIPLVQRRIAVALQLVSYPLFCTLGMVAGLPVSVSTLLGLLVFAGLCVYLYRGTGLWQFGNAPDEQLDERQMQVRDRAYRSAYIGVSALVITLFAGLFLADSFGLTIPHGYDQLSVLFYSIFTFILVLPSAVLAWSESVI